MKNSNNLGQKFIYYSGLIFFFYLFLTSSTVIEDAYITFRVVDNFVNGHGLRWNINERVQTYTHPLWMMTIIPFYWLTREMFFTPILVSVTISLLTMALLFRKIAKSSNRMLLATLLISFSGSFVFYSNCGLENTLTHLLLLTFWILMLDDYNSLNTLLYLSFIAGLSTLNRMDTFLLYIPGLIYSYLTVKKYSKGVLCIITGFLPFLLWEIFAILYYGFPFPNTAYAKLGGGVDRSTFLSSGVEYYIRVTKEDLPTIIVMFLPFAALPGNKDKRLLIGLTSIVIYCLYIVWIGGDFLWKGRFLTPVFLLSVILSLKYIKWERTEIFLSVLGIMLVSPFFQKGSLPIFFISENARDSLVLKPGDESKVGGVYMRNSSALINWRPWKKMPCHYFVKAGEKYREQSKDSKIVVVEGAVGMLGFFAGPQVHIIDPFAIGEPLLARMPSIYRPKILIGHLARCIPQGYIETIQYGKNLINDSNLAIYYEHLRIITQGPVLSKERLLEILKINLGLYDHLIDKDVWKFPYILVKEYDNLIEELGKLPESQPLLVNNVSRGVEIQFEDTKYLGSITMKASEEYQYQVLFYKKGKLLKKANINKFNIENGFFKCHVPTKVKKLGFDKIRIIAFPYFTARGDHFRQITWWIKEISLK